jgi:hypothetical protein
MSGGFAHDQVLLNRLASALAPYATWRRWEVRVRGPGFIGFLDFVAQNDGELLVVEAELTPKRIRRDVVKAQLLGAQFLRILVPNAKVRAGRPRDNSRKRPPKASQLRKYVFRR